MDPLLQTIPGLESESEIYATDRYRQPVSVSSDALEPSPHLEQVGSNPFTLDCDLTITAEVRIIGSDAAQSAILLAHPSVSPNHARIRRTPSGSVALADMRSATGTWVNYAPISSTGTVLKDGDLVRIGDFTFRYRLGLTQEGR